MPSKRLEALRPLLLATAVAGFLLINLPFLYLVVTEEAAIAAAMSNGMALIFMAEAFLLLFLLAFLIARLGPAKPGWVLFVILSLLGSLAFSIPMYLYLVARAGAAGDATPANS